MRRSLLALALSLLILAASNDVLAQQRMTTLRRVQGSDARRGKYNVAWVQLTQRFATPAVRARVNADLEREARGYICEPSADRERVRSYEAEYGMEVTHLSARLLGIMTTHDVFCGGAHPSHGPGSLLYDLRTGRRLSVEGEMADSAGFRRFVARRALAAKPRNAGECSDVYTLENLAETGYVYLLTNRGLTATQDYPHVIQACGYDTRIAYADLARFLKPSSPLRTLVARRP